MKQLFHRTTASYRNRSYLDLIAGVPCVRCLIHKNILTNNTVPAHYTGEFQHAFGKGGSVKCDDHCVASLCHQCHTEGDDPSIEWPEGTKSELWMFYILMTQMWLLTSESAVLKAASK